MATRRRNAPDSQLPRTFTRLREMRRFERRNLSFLQTLADIDLVLEIGYRQALQAPLNLKEIPQLGLASPATTQRRLRRLHRLGAVARLRSERDRRAAQLTLTRETLEKFARYSELLEPGAAQS